MILVNNASGDIDEDWLPMMPLAAGCTGCATRRVQRLLPTPLDIIRYNGRIDSTSDGDCMRDLGSLEPQGPYNLRLTMDLLRRYAHPALDVTHDNAYWRLIYCQRGLHLLRVTQEGPVNQPRLRVALALSTIKPDPDALMRIIGHILGVDSDPTPFYKAARRDPDLWAIVRPMIGLRWLRTETVFEALMLTIIEQQIAWTAAQRAQRWLVEWGGQCLSYQGRDYYAFPRPGQIASTSVEALTPLKITFRRMAVMIDIARAAAVGSIALEDLRHQTPEAAYNALTARKGIGHWTAVWTLQRTQSQPHNFVGYNDVALQAACNHYFRASDGKMSEEEVRLIFARFGPFAGLAANYTIMRWVLDRYPA
ncbi:MAG: DNA-3-methyladenine glycosylase family protein [Chloroflexota bacterium]